LTRNMGSICENISASRSPLTIYTACCRMRKSRGQVKVVRCDREIWRNRCSGGVRSGNDPLYILINQ
jgi:hypothetical protein